MDVYVVTCFMEGCEECGNVYHVVGVFAKLEDAQKQEKEHSKGNGGHLHSNNVETIVLKLQ